MGGQTQESVSQNLVTPEALIDFVEELRHAGFNIGMAEYIAAQDLLLMLTSRGENLNNPQRASSLFGPLLCSSPAEQDTFPEFFRRWYERQKAKLGAREIPHEETMAETLEDTAKRGLRWEWILFVFGVIILVLTAWFVSRSFLDSELQPAPSPAAIPDATSDVLPLIQLASVALGLLGIAYFAWWAWWRRTANQFLQRRQSQETPDIKQISLTASDEALFPSLTFLSLARLFRQRVQVVSKDLNVVATVESSVENGGWLNPIYDHLLIPPEYLVLVDRRNRFDHLGEFVDGMVRRLEEHGVFITAYAFDGDPRLCFPLHGNGAPQSLNELAARYENMRLIVFTEAQGLLSPTSGRLSPWSRLFNRWVHRSVLTPEPPDSWGVSEYELQREFTVLPGTTEGLAAFIRIIQGQEKLGEINTWLDSALPQVLQERPQRWLEKDAPSASQIDSLLDNLKLYLGEDGYTWLKACAVYPELQWQITITLGQLLKDNVGNPLLNSKRLIDLARLPWFRYGTMPDWLRTRLIQDLEPDQEKEIRNVLEALFVTAVQGHGESLDLEIAYERHDWTSRLARPLLKLLRQNTSMESSLSDHVFLDFMLQRFNLAVRFPEMLRSRLFAHTDNQPGWKIFVQWIGVNLIPFLMVPATYSSVATTFRPFSIGAETINLSLGSILISILHGIFLGLVQIWFLRKYWRLNRWLWITSSLIATSVFGFVGYYYDKYLFVLPYGLISLALMGILQTRILYSYHGLKALIWFYSLTLAGVCNTIFSYLYLSLSTFPNNDLLMMIVVTLCNTLIYSLLSGWALLFIIYSKSLNQDRLIRLTWLFAVPLGLSLGIGLGDIIGAVSFPYLFRAASDIVKSIPIVLYAAIWMALFSFSQLIVLRLFRFNGTGLWSAITFLTTFLFFIFSNWVTGWEYDPSMLNDVNWSVLFGLGAGVLSSLGQAIVLYRNGLEPYAILLWILSATLGWSLTFITLASIDVNRILALSDMILLKVLLVGAGYSLVTSFILQALLKVNIRAKHFGAN